MGPNRWVQSFLDVSIVMLALSAASLVPGAVSAFHGLVSDVRREQGCFRAHRRYLRCAWRSSGDGLERGQVLTHHGGGAPLAGPPPVMHQESYEEISGGRF